MGTKELKPKIESCLTQLEEMKEELRALRQRHAVQSAVLQHHELPQRESAKKSVHSAQKNVSSSAGSKVMGLASDGTSATARVLNPDEIKSSLKKFEENKDFYSLKKEEQIKRTIWRRGVPARDLKHYLQDELEQESSCIGLIWAMMMLLFFCIGAFQHMRLEQVHAEDFAVTFDIVENANFAFTGSQPFENGRIGHKNIDDVNSIADFWSWVNLGLVPIFFPVEGAWDVSESRTNTGVICQSFQEALLGYGGYNATSVEDVEDTSGIHGSIVNQGGANCPELAENQPKWPEGFLANTNEQSAHTYLYYHSIIAGARMRQEYIPTEPACEAEDTWKGHLFTGKCVPGISPNYKLEPEPVQAIFSNEHLINASRTRFLLTHTEQSELRRQLRDMENEVWFSPHTSKVEIMFTTYNQHMNAITVVFCNFFLNRAGHIHKVVEPITTFLSPYEGWQNYLWDVLWLLMVVKLAFDEIPDIYGNIKEDGVVHGFRNYLSIGNFIDWINIVYSIVICVMWFFHLSNLDSLKSKLLTADISTAGSWATEQERNDFYDTVILVVRLQHYFRRVLAFYPMVVVSKFLKVFSYSPRLALMTDTLYQASTDILHFAVVFFTVFCIYTLSGMLLFGQEVLAFANFYRSMDETFKIVMRDFDWEELRRVGRAEALLWFGSFMVMVHLIMLNMLLAIVMDVYAGVKSALPEDADTLWSQLWEVYERKRDVWWLGTRVSLRKVKEVLDFPKGDDEAEAWKLDQHFIVKLPQSEAVFCFERKDTTRRMDVDSDGVQLHLAEKLTIGKVHEDGCPLASGRAIDEDVDLELDPSYEGFDVMEAEINGTAHLVTGNTQASIYTLTNEKPSFSLKVRSDLLDDDECCIVGLMDMLLQHDPPVIMSKEQARIILMAAVKHNEQGNMEGSTISDTNNRIAQIGESVSQLKKLAEMNSRLVAEDFDFHAQTRLTS